MVRPYTSPLLAELQALGVLFASPPPGSLNLAGVVFDESGVATGIQNSAGVVAGFPGAGTVVQTTKGDLIGFSTTPTRIPVGANKLVPIADSTQPTGIRWADVAWHESSQPVNAYVEIVVPTNGTTYVDNVATVENRSQNASGQRGNAAFRFRDALTGYERGAIGYSALSTDNPAFLPNLLYCEIGNLSPDALDTEFAVVNTHPVGSVNLPGTSYKAFAVRGTNGRIDMLAGPTGTSSINMTGNINVSTVGNPRQILNWGFTTAIRLRERDSDDLFAWTTNVDNSITKDNIAKTAWRQQMGYGTGENRYRISYMPIGLNTWVDLITVDTAVVTVTVPIKVPVLTVATLPAAATVGAGSHACVTDALAPTFLAAVVGGGAIFTPVHSDGTVWRCG